LASPVSRISEDDDERWRVRCYSCQFSCIDDELPEGPGSPNRRRECATRLLLSNMLGACRPMGRGFESAHAAADAVTAEAQVIALPHLSRSCRAPYVPYHVARRTVATHATFVT
jgi:hypothetical protein